MKNNFLRIGIFLAVLASCNGKHKIISIPDMKFIIWDMLNAGQLGKMGVPRDSAALKLKKSTVLFEQVLSIHQVSREQFYESYQFYEEHPGQFRILFDSVEAYGNRQSASATKVPTP